MKIFRGANGFLKSFVTTLKIAVRSFSKQQLTVFYILCILLVISTVLMLGQINKKYLVEVPAYGGKIDEGIIGT
jgi:hypothetical protein